MSKNISSVFLCLSLLLHSLSASARYAAIVIDADSGRVIHENESTQRWYPASLTKVMTMYMTFMALETGRLQLDEKLTVSRHASLQPTSKLGLLQGQTITVEQAIMAVTTRSANDAAVLLAERLGGTEGYFASMMTHQAQSMGMYNSSFQNASGLPDEGQISSARDLALLSAALIRDFPQYYRFFSATEFRYRGRVLPNTNRILKTYPDADGMKTGFTCGSGYNLIASAKRNGHRIIGVLLGAHSSGERFQQMGNLLDVGFEKSSAGALGIPVTQFRDGNSAPPPFQLSANRCAGSAMQMGADAGSSTRPEPIQIKPQQKGQRLVSYQPSRGVADWSVTFGSEAKKIHTEANLSLARRTLGSLGKSGQPQIVSRKLKGKQFWRVLWRGLPQTDASSFCQKLRTKIDDCTVLPGKGSLKVAARSSKSHRSVH